MKAHRQREREVSGVCITEMEAGEWARITRKPRTSSRSPTQEANKQLTHLANLYLYATRVPPYSGPPAATACKRDRVKNKKQRIKRTGAGVNQAHISAVTAVSTYCPSTDRTGRTMTTVAVLHSNEDQRLDVFPDPHCGGPNRHRPTWIGRGWSGYSM
jgi:hypothetical protein